MRMFMVGGAVRDELIGTYSKDIDFSVVLDPQEIGEVGFLDGHKKGVPFRFMVMELEKKGFKIFLESPEFLTVRAMFPKDHITYPGKAADFVLARKEGEYTDGRRPDVVEPGTLMDDLRRRDFTMNAIAKDEDGTLIDPFDGQDDIRRKIIRAVDDPVERLAEDALRAVRAVRFAVTKKFKIDPLLASALEFRPVLDALAQNISEERINEEVSKMFRFDTLESLRIFDRFRDLRTAVFSGKVSLDSTLKQRGRRK